MKSVEAAVIRGHIEAFESANPEHVGKHDFEANPLFDWLGEKRRCLNISCVAMMPMTVKSGTLHLIPGDLK